MASGIALLGSWIVIAMAGDELRHILALSPTAGDTIFVLWTRRS